MDDGETFVRAIYATHELAAADVDVKPLRDSYSGHDKNCCTVNAWRVLEAADLILVRP